MFKSVLSLLAIATVAVTAQASSTYTDCTFKSGNDLFDLSPLRQPYGYDEYRYTDSSGNAYYMNVCAVEKAIKCDQVGAVACQISGSSVYTLGQLGTQSISLASGYYTEGVEISYTGGTLCKATGHPRTLKYVVLCEEGGEPTVTSVEETRCSYVVTMTADAACPSRASGFPSSVSTHTTSVTSEYCSFVSSTTGYLYDFSSLTRHYDYDWQISDSAGNHYYVNVCADQSTISCVDPTPVCQVPYENSFTPTVSCGELGSQHFSTDYGVPTVTYSYGTKCANGVGRSSKIEVLCGKNTTPVLSSVTEDSCSYTFTFVGVAGCGVNVKPSTPLFFPTSVPDTTTAGITCRECDIFVGTLFGLIQAGKSSYFSGSTNYSSTRIYEYINESLCEYVAETAQCEDFVSKYGDAVYEAIVGAHLKTISAVCQRIGLC